MATTDKYDFEEVSYGTQGWNGILTTNLEKVDDYLHTNLLITLGETVAAKVPIYIASDGKGYKAQANRVKVPAMGLTIEAGILNDEVRVQRIGPITDVGWTWTVPKPVFLSPTVPGGLTQTRPSLDRMQLMGIPVSATILILTGVIDYSALVATTTTTTTSTTTTTTSTSTTTTTV